MCCLNWYLGDLPLSLLTVGDPRMAGHAVLSPSGITGSLVPTWELRLVEMPGAPWSPALSLHLYRWRMAICSLKTAARCGWRQWVSQGLCWKSRLLQKHLMKGASPEQAACQGWDPLVCPHPSFQHLVAIVLDCLLLFGLLLSWSHCCVSPHRCLHFTN